MNSLDEKDEIAFILKRLKNTFGEPPDVFKVMLESKELLSSADYMRESLSVLDLSPIERELLIYFFSFLNDSQFCIDIHHELLVMHGFNYSKVAEEKEFFNIKDSKLVELLKFSKAIYLSQGHATEEEKKSFLDAGYTTKNQLEVLLIFSFSHCVNSVSRFFNLKSYT